MQNRNSNDNEARPTTRSDATDDLEENEARLRKLYLLRADNDLFAEEGQPSKQIIRIIYIL